MMTDTIADLLTRIRNANMVQLENVEIPASNTKVSILEILKEEGYINGFNRIEDDKQGLLKIEMKYSPKGESIIHKLVRISKPSRRVYVKSQNIETACNGLGVTIISTSQGMMTGQNAKRKNIGGEIICEI